MMKVAVCTLVPKFMELNDLIKGAMSANSSGALTPLTAFPQATQHVIVQDRPFERIPEDTGLRRAVLTVRIVKTYGQ